MNLQARVASLSRGQMALLGGVAGYSVGVVTGPVLRAGITLIVISIVALAWKSVEDHFQSRLGFAGLLLAVFLCNSLGAIERFVGGLLGGVFEAASRLGLAAAGALIFVQLREAAVGADLDDEFEDD